MFEVWNGFCGMKRDIVLRLCNLLFYRNHLIRMIIGMCKEHFLWKSHAYFRKGRRPVDLPLCFLSNPKAGSNVTITGSMFEHREEGSCVYSFFLDKEIVCGIYKAVFFFKRNIYCGSVRVCGLAHKSILAKIHAKSFLCENQACAICCNGIYAGGIKKYDHELFWQYNERKVTLELHAGVAEMQGEQKGEEVNGGSLFFFVDGKQIPCSITKVPPSVHFGFSLYDYLIVVVESFQTLAASTTNRSVECCQYQWK